MPANIPDRPSPPKHRTMLRGWDEAPTWAYVAAIPLMSFAGWLLYRPVDEVAGKFFDYVNAQPVVGLMHWQIPVIFALLALLGLASLAFKGMALIAIALLTKRLCEPTATRRRTPPVRRRRP